MATSIRRTSTHAVAPVLPVQALVTAEAGPSRDPFFPFLDWREAVMKAEGQRMDAESPSAMSCSDRLIAC